MIMQLPIQLLSHFFDNSLKEDVGIGGDITSEALLLNMKNHKVRFVINTRDDIVLSGLDIAEYFLQRHSNISYTKNFCDGDRVKKQSNIIEGEGNPLDILRLERVILNYLQHLSAVATLTHKYVSAVDGTGVKIYDTRKTIPGLRILQKYAVRCGGGYNHRLALDSSILIKDNHIAICGGVHNALTMAKKSAPHYTKIEIECDTISQLREALDNGVDIIMLDNMSISELQEAVRINNKVAVLEVSGGVMLDNVRQIALTGVDMISVGKLTHSASAVDIGLDID
jgi:nicotinate-nucleotide pyrophosphorylase (carboxylating)